MQLSLNPKTYLEADGKELFCFSARWAFGFWLLYIGINKWLGGPANFIGYIGGSFSETWVPPILTTILGWIIIILEPLLGALLMIGWKERLVWLATTKLMFMLMLGQTILGKWDVVANNWQYVFFCMILMGLSGPCQSCTKNN